jgi:uncharacterized membrane protein YdjX (TVP38/TMEM64 family)
LSKSKLLVIAIIAAAITAFFVFDLKQYISLDYFQAQREAINTAVATDPFRAGLLFFAIYTVATGLSLPGAAVLTLIAGAVFGLLWGTVIVSFASTIGATLAFLTSRFLLRDWVQQHFGDKLRPINEGVAREGAFYLFALRLVPVFPFVAINLLMGLTPIRTRTYFWVSQLGMLAGTAVFVNAGTQISRIESTAGLLSPTLIASFVALALFPWAAKAIVAVVKRSRG